MVSEQSEDGSQNEYVQRVRDALADIGHLEYNEVEAAPRGDGVVRVRVGDHMENALVNNGEFAAFHRAGFVGLHVDFDERFIDVRPMDGGD